jgi:hypothetical protein
MGTQVVQGKILRPVRLQKLGVVVFASFEGKGHAEALVDGVDIPQP